MFPLITSRDDSAAVEDEKCTVRIFVLELLNPYVSFLGQKIYSVLLKNDVSPPLFFVSCGPGWNRSRCSLTAAAVA